ncbi:hypothetical protein BS78_10G013800 [Paspalum vaginatum]|nr:hypothetical protein BS78_10G013800 [Paspalum vaginatum]
MTAADRGDGGGTGKHQPTFWCLNVARYTVAAVVTVLIFLVVVVAIKFVLRPDSLHLSVVGGSVHSTPQPRKKAVTLALNIRAENPSGRARMYLLNITAYLFGNATQASTPTPNEDCIILFKPVDEAVRQQTAVDSMTSVEVPDDPGVMDTSYFDALYTKGGAISDAMLRVEGSLITEVTSRINRTRPVTYYCGPLLVGGDEASKSKGRNDDVPCTDKNLAAAQS